MNFMQFLKSLDDLLYEVMSWVVFYPITFWGTLSRPWAMMDYADAQLELPEADQYGETLSPPLFLLLTLLLSHGIELTLVGESSLIASKHGLAALISDDTSLLMMRLLVFSIFPLIMAVRLVRRQHQGLTRDTLRQPFYAQCYLAGPFALMIGLGGLVTQTPWSWGHGAGLMLMAAAFLWYGGLQVSWFARKLELPIWRGFLTASIGMIESLVAIALLAPLLV
ncbi:hypothetical protein TPR58_11155 [Sphingomonas sp. HF-S3]|uniref:Permease n=1 Tax=Sphingomonas rustica TaxID=3103142 RepID=A0ABV0BAI7_9SPHN